MNFFFSLVYFGISVYGFDVYRFRSKQFPNWICRCPNWEMRKRYFEEKENVLLKIRIFSHTCSLSFFRKDVTSFSMRKSQRVLLSVILIFFAIVLSVVVLVLIRRRCKRETHNSFDYSPLLSGDENSNTQQKPGDGECTILPMLEYDDDGDDLEKSDLILHHRHNKENGKEKEKREK